MLIFPNPSADGNIGVRIVAESLEIFPVVIIPRKTCEPCKLITQLQPEAFTTVAEIP